MDIQKKFIDLPSGFKVYCRFREAAHSEWLVVTHGIGEHSGRYDFIFEEFGHRYNILTYDLRGHGKSAGKKAYIEDFSQFRYDLNELLLYFENHYNLKKFVLFGHSMGALITSDYLQKHKTQKNNVINSDFYPKLVFLSSLPVSPGGVLGKILSFIPDIVFDQLASLPVGLSLGGLVDIKELSHDIYTQEDYKTDPLVAKKLHTKLLFELIKTSRKVAKKPLNTSCPIYAVVGSEDKVVDPEVLKEYSKSIEPKMNLKTFVGGRHELHNEIDRIRNDYLTYLKSVL